MNLRQFDLNLLVALDVLLMERNVTRAAEQLFLSQPAMSGMLSRLRLAFGDELLVRVGRHLELTELAADIKEHVHECIRDLEDLLDTTRPFELATDASAFRISVTDYAALLIFGPLMQKLTQFAPNMSAHFLRLGLSVGEHLIRGEIDFAVLPADFEPSLPSLPLFNDTWVCVAWAGHPTLGDSLTVDEFDKHPHLSFNISDPVHISLADDFVLRQGQARKVVASTASFAAAPFLINGTSLLSIVPRRLAERMQVAAELRLLELPFEVPPLCEKLAWNPRFTTNPAHAWMRKQIVAVTALL